MRATVKRLATIVLILAGMMTVAVTMSAPASAITATTARGYFLVVGDGNAQGNSDDPDSYATYVLKKIKA